MDEEAIKAEIEALKAKLTGNLFDDGDTQMKIYELKKQLHPKIETAPAIADEDDDGCLYCGS